MSLPDDDAYIRIFLCVVELPSPGESICDAFVYVETTIIERAVAGEDND